VNGDHVQVEGCHFSRWNPATGAAAACCITAATDYSVFSGNTFQECGNCPIYGAGAVSHCVFQGNIFDNQNVTGIGQAGICVESANSDENSFIGNIFDLDGAKVGISVGDTDGHCFVANVGANASIARSGAKKNLGYSENLASGPSVVDPSTNTTSINLNNVGSYS
jgi:hypothetical protein